MIIQQVEEKLNGFTPKLQARRPRLEINLPGVAGSPGMSFEVALKSMLAFFEAFGENILARSIPALRDPIAAIGLFEGLAMARLFNSGGGTFASMGLPPLTLVDNFTLDRDCSVTIAWAIVEAAGELEKLHQAEHHFLNLLLAEALLVAFALITQDQGLEISREQSAIVTRAEQRAIVARAGHYRAISADPETARALGFEIPEVESRPELGTGIRQRPRKTKA